MARTQRRSASTTAGAAARRAGDLSVRRPTRLGRRISEKLDSSGQSQKAVLRRVREEHGVTLSASTLSTWITGRLPRRDGSDRVAIEALEGVLDCTAGELWLALEADRADRADRFNRPAAHSAAGPGLRLPATRPGSEESQVERLRRFVRECGSSDDYAVTAVKELVEIGADRYERERRVRLNVRAFSDRTDCYRLVFEPSPTSKLPIFPSLHCRVGRRVPWEDDLACVELLFDRVLRRGESHVLEYVERGPRRGSPLSWVRRGIGHSAVDMLTTAVRFETPPKQVFTCRWDQRGQRPVERVEVELVDRVATLSIPKPAPGLWGLAWLW